MLFKKEFLTIFLIQVTEVLGFSLVLPFLPYYAESLGASPLLIALILTSFSLFQFISAPIMGRLSDYYGRKPLLILSQLSTFISFLVLTFAKSIPVIFLSRAIDGLVGSNNAIAQAYLSDISSRKDRSKAFGLSGAAFSFGFLIGPAIGGFLFKFGYWFPALLAASMSLISIFMTSLLLEETVKEKVRHEIKIIDLTNVRKYFSHAKIGRELWKFFAYLLTHVVFVSNFALFAKYQLGFNPQKIGFFLTYVGLVGIVFRVFLLGILIEKLSEKRLRALGSFNIIFGLLAVAISKNTFGFMLAISFFATGNAIFRPLMMGVISREVSSKQQGQIIGVTNSLSSMSQIFGPLIGGAIINLLPSSMLGVGAASIMILGLLI